MSNTSNFSNKNPNFGLKIILFLLLLSLLGTITYIYKIHQENKDLLLKVNSKVTEKAKLEDELKSKIAEYGLAIADNTALKSELEDEQTKMKELLEKVKNSDGKSSSLIDLKNDYARLNREMGLLLTENSGLKEKNMQLTKEVQKTATALNSAKTANDTLRNKNSNMNQLLEKGVKIAIVNLKATAIKKKSSGKEEVVEKASKVNIIRINFAIAENNLALRGFKKYYIQIIDQGKNFAGDAKTEVFKNGTLQYSMMKEVMYENKTIEIKEDYVVANLKAGTFFVNLFDAEGKLVSNTSITLL